MGKLSAQVKDFMERYKIASDEIWEVHGSTWVVKHKALERIAAEVGIVWDRPAMVETKSSEGIAVMAVFGKLGDKAEWSMGEASPKNNKNAYPYAMAEKRAKDRVILKLLNTHGALHSEAEADEFEQPRRNPHVTRPEDVFDEISTDIPHSDEKKMKVKDARPEYAALVKEMQRIQDPQELREWGEAQKSVINSLPGSWPQSFRGEYAKHKASISNVLMAG